MKIFFHCAILLSFSGCTQSTGLDHSTITEPYARWQAHNITNYTVEQKRLCFCVDGGVSFRVVVKNNIAVDVVDLRSGTSLPQDRRQYFKTIDELFDIIRSVNPDSVAALRISYDSIWGYPNSLWLDPSAQMADEEYGYDCQRLMTTN